MSPTALPTHLAPPEPPARVAHVAPDAGAVLDAALEALPVEHAHAEASRSRAAALLTACGVLLALTAGLGSAAAQAAQRLSYLGAAITVCAAALTALLLVGAAAVAGQMFARSNKSRVALEEMRDLAEVRFGVSDPKLLSEAALEPLATARAANLRSCSRSIHAMAPLCRRARCVGRTGAAHRHRPPARHLNGGCSG